MASLIPAEPTDRIPLTNILKATIVAIVAVAVANALLYFITDAMGAFPSDVTIQGRSGDEMSFGVGPVMFASTFAMVMAGVIFGIVSRITRRPFRVFGIVAAVVFLLSLFSPFTIEDAPAGMIISLVLMHAVAAALGVFVLFRLSTW